MLNMDLSIGDLDGQAVVALRGESNLADTPGVASHLIAAVAACGPSVIVDLAGLEGIDYSGLSVLLRIWKWTRQSGGDMPLAALQQPVRQVLEATGPDRCLLGLSQRGRSREQPKTGSGVIVSGPAAAPCRHGYPAGRPAAGTPYCRPSLARPLPRRGT